MAKDHVLVTLEDILKLVQYFNKALQINPNDAYALKNKNVVISHIASLPLPDNTSSIQPQQQKEIIITKNRTSNPMATSPQQQQQPTPPPFQLQPQQQQRQAAYTTSIPTTTAAAAATATYTTSIPTTTAAAAATATATYTTSIPTTTTAATISQIPGFVSKSGLPNSTTPTVGFAANGTIDSVLYVPNVRWIATGNWSIAADNGTLAYCTVNMVYGIITMVPITHTHEFQNFQPRGEIITGRPINNNVVLKGVVDVGTNHRIKWKECSNLN